MAAESSQLFCAAVMIVRGDPVVVSNDQLDKTIVAESDDIRFEQRARPYDCVAVFDLEKKRGTTVRFEHVQKDRVILARLSGISRGGDGLAQN